MATEHESQGLASSLTDLMTSLAVIFILLFVAVLNNVRQAEIQKTTGIRNDVVKALQKAFKGFTKEEVDVEADKNDPFLLLVVVGNNPLRFGQDKSDILPDGTHFLNRFTPPFVSTICSKDLKKEIDSIVVEGHTSEEGGDDINLPLSQERSMAVVKATLSILGEPSSAGKKTANFHDCFLDLVSATGRGSREPVPSKNGLEDREGSRRVVIKIRIKSEEQKALGEGMIAGDRPATEVQHP